MRKNFIVQSIGILSLSVLVTACPDPTNKNKALAEFPYCVKLVNCADSFPTTNGDFWYSALGVGTAFELKNGKSVGRKIHGFDEGQSVDIANDILGCGNLDLSFKEENKTLGFSPTAFDPENASISFGPEKDGIPYYKYNGEVLKFVKTKTLPASEKDSRKAYCGKTYGNGKTSIDEGCKSVCKKITTRLDGGVTCVDVSPVYGYRDIKCYELPDGYKVTYDCKTSYNTKEFAYFDQASGERLMLDVKSGQILQSLDGFNTPYVASTNEKADQVVLKPEKLEIKASLGAAELTFNCQNPQGTPIAELAEALDPEKAGKGSIIQKLQEFFNLEKEIATLLPNECIDERECGKTNLTPRNNVQEFEGQEVDDREESSASIKSV